MPLAQASVAFGGRDPPVGHQLHMILSKNNRKYSLKSSPAPHIITLYMTTALISTNTPAVSGRRSVGGGQWAAVSGRRLMGGS